MSIMGGVERGFLVSLFFPSLDRFGAGVGKEMLQMARLYFHLHG